MTLREAPISSGYASVETEPCPPKGQADAPSEAKLPETLGDEAAGFRSDQRAADGTAVSVFIIVFRFANVSNALLVSGVAARFDVATATDIARRQLARQRP